MPSAGAGKFPAGAGGEYVDVAERLMRGSERRTGGLDVPHVGRHTHGLGPELPESMNGRVHPVLRPTHHRHARTSRGETLRDARLIPLVPPATNTATPR